MTVEICDGLLSDLPELAVALGPVLLLVVVGIVGVLVVFLSHAAKILDGLAGVVRACRCGDELDP